MRTVWKLALFSPAAAAMSLSSAALAQPTKAHAEEESAAAAASPPTNGPTSPAPDPDVEGDWLSMHLGPHATIGVGPSMSSLLSTSESIFGVSTGAFLHVGLTSMLDFRVGLAGDAAGSRVSQLSAGVPVALRLNLGDVYSMSVGGFVGVVTDTTTVGLSAGPEWSILTYRFGRLRELELSLQQGIHFHLGRASGAPDLSHVQSTISLMYTYFDHEAGEPRFSRDRQRGAAKR